MRTRILTILLLFTFTLPAFADNTEIEVLKKQVEELTAVVKALNSRIEYLEHENTAKNSVSVSQPAAPVVSNPACQNQNPDISVTGVFAVKGTGDKKDSDRNSLKTAGTEINFTKAVSPYTRANATFGFHDEEVHVEEAYADIAFILPWDLELRAGRFMAPVGYINGIHSHDWPFAVRPFTTSYFQGGEHGYNDDGISLSKLFDVNERTYLKASIEALNGNNESLFNDGQTRVYGGRLVSSTQFNDKDDLHIGADYHLGACDAAGDMDSKVYGTDVMFRHRINQFDRMTLWGEWIWNSREQAMSGSETSNAYYVSGMYKFRKDHDWHIGLSYDCAEKPADNSHRTIAKSIYAGYWLTENDRLQLQFRSIDDPFKGRNNNEIWLQFIWGIGPHKPHLSNF